MSFERRTSTSFSGPVQRTATQIAQGQEAVFRYGQRLKTWADQNSFWHPRLWCFLVGPVILTTVLLSVTVNIFWKNSFDHGMARQQQTDAMILSNFNETSTDILSQMADQLQASTAETAVHRVARYADQPSLVVKINAEIVRSMPLSLPKSEQLNLLFTRMWQETTNLFPEVDYIYYGDKFGSFVGYERLPPDFIDQFKEPTVFGAEFKAYDGAPAVQLCEMCPPASAVHPGEKTYYFVNAQGKYLQTYQRTSYDPRVRPWYQKATEAKGELTWLGVYNHSSGHTLGITATKAIMKGSEVVAVLAADFTIAYFSEYLRSVTGVIRGEQAFIIAMDSGLMVASSHGIDHVARKVEGGFEQYHWSQVPDQMVHSSIETLLAHYHQLKNLPLNGTLRSDGGKFLLTFSQGLPSSFQVLQHWLVVVTCPVKVFMERSWQEQKWASQRSSMVREELHADLMRQEVKTIWTCGSFALLGAVVMACVGLAVTRPLKKISTDMLSMAKLEFLPESTLRPPRPQALHRRNSTSFVSLRQLGRLVSRTFVRSRGNTEEESEEDSETSSSERDDSSSEERVIDLEDRATCWSHATPKEVVNMRESFIYMVAGLKSFARYMDPEILRVLVKSRRQAQLGMGRAEVTVFFSDIANFTTIAESLEPEVFMSMLGKYLDEMSKIIMAKQGVIGEFIGDAIMAWWNVPLDLGPVHTSMALDAALTQQHRLHGLREQWQQRQLPDVRVRMGLVRGNVLAGNIGSSQRMKYGLVGDSVNLASRLEGLCKYYGVSIIIEQEAAGAPNVRERYQLRLLDLAIVKGRTQATELFELISERNQPEQSGLGQEELSYFVDGYAAIHRLYRLKSFEACAGALNEYRLRFPDDVPSKMLLRRVETLLEQGHPVDWTPVHKLTEK